MTARAVVSQRIKPGMMLMYHAQEKIVNTPGSEMTGKRGGIHNSVTRTVLKPTHMIGGYAQQSYGFNYYGTVGSNRDEFVVVRKMANVDWLEGPLDQPDASSGGRRMKIRAQIAMVLNLDKCIGCHTCSVTCKNVWTNREGVEYAWFNNVETKPGVGYPKEWENQKKWNGGWRRKKNGASSRRWAPSGASSPTSSPIRTCRRSTTTTSLSPSTTSISIRRRNRRPFRPPVRARPSPASAWRRSSGARTGRRSSAANSRSARKDVNFEGVEKDIYGQFENTFMMYLPRLCEHCLNPACAAVCPSGAIYKREEDGIVLIDQDKCRGWRMCVSGCPYKKIYYNWSSGKSEKCIFCYPRIEAGQPTVCAETCVGRIRYLGVLLYDADRHRGGGEHSGREGPLSGPARPLPRSE